MLIDFLMALGSPIPWLIAVMVYATCRNQWERRRQLKTGRLLRGSSSALAAAAIAFQFFTLIHRPNHAFVAKARIEQQEKSDEDDDGGPETPIKHLHRQLRRVRRGERVDRLVWRLE